MGVLLLPPAAQCTVEIPLHDALVLAQHSPCLWTSKPTGTTLQASGPPHSRCVPQLVPLPAVVHHLIKNQPEAQHKSRQFCQQTEGGSPGDCEQGRKSLERLL